MVYIRLTPQLWTLSGIQSLSSSTQITKIQQIRYISYQHFKEAANKTDAQIHCLIKRQNIISNLQMKKIIKEAERTPEQKKQSEELRNRHMIRTSYKNRNKNNESASSYYFEQKKDESIKDLSKSISFGLTFIFSFFMAGLTGYYFGIYFLSFSTTQAMILAIGFIIFTIVVETTLFIIRQDREDTKEMKKRKKMKSAQTPQQPLSFKIPAGNIRISQNKKND